MPGNTALTIGEVIERLSEEFPDITVSKVRFLESQGLVEPGRTPSGYRQFTTGDVDLLRWVLRQQREHFLPLKVIRKVLEGTGGRVPEPDGEVDESEVSPFRERGRSRRFVGSVSVSLEELAVTGGVDPAVVAQLERLGLLVGHEAGSAIVYDGEALHVVRLVARFLELGVDARHLRMFLVGAQREAGVLEQALLPRLRGDDRSRREVRAQLDELVDAGSQLREILLRRSLGRLDDQS
jgi:DNA-binding transcriptional MerR regulator